MNYEKKLNCKDKYICLFCKESQIFVFIWSYIFMERKTEDKKN